MPGKVDDEAIECESEKSSSAVRRAVEKRQEASCGQGRAGEQEDERQHERKGEDKVNMRQS